MKFFYLIIPILLLTNCSTDSPSDIYQDQSSEVQIPESFSGSSSDIISTFKRYSPNIIDELYEEAMDKDPELKDLHEKANAILKKKDSKVKNFSEYNYEVQAYLDAADRQLNAINDSLLSERLKIHFDNIEKSHDQSISNHKSGITDLGDLSRRLRDKMITLKLLVTAPMMQVYQKNELPNIEEINSVKNELEEILKEIENRKEVNSAIN